MLLAAETWVNTAKSASYFGIDTSDQEIYIRFMISGGPKNL